MLAKLATINCLTGNSMGVSKNYETAIILGAPKCGSAPRSSASV